MKYFFHTTLDGVWSLDNAGTYLTDDKAAISQASDYLVEVAAGLIPLRGSRRFGVEVKDACGRDVTAVGFTLHGGPATPW